MSHYRKMLASGTLIGDAVFNAFDEEIGHIQELMINVHDGRVGYAVLSFGGVLGFGNKYFAVPWAVLRVDQDKKCFVLNADKSKLENAPGFDKSHWPDMADQTWIDAIHDYYGTKVYLKDDTSE